MRRLLLLSSLTLLGCQSYKTGQSTPMAESVWVAPVVNASYVPQMDLAVTERLRDAFMSDALVRLVRKDVADTVLQVTINGLEREGHAQGLEMPVRTSNGGTNLEEDTGMSQAFDLVLRAHVVLSDASDASIVYEDDFVVSTQSIPTPFYRGSADEERLLLPILARELARQIHDAVSSQWAPMEPPGNG